MRFRLKAFALHVSLSATAMLIVMGSLYLGWYHWPGWYLTQVLHVAVIVLGVDVALGPLVTLLIASPQKPKPELVRDVAMIVTVQLGALIYGAATLWLGRPLYYTFSVDRLQLVQARDISAADADAARHYTPQLAPHWYSTPRWVYAPLPDDPKVRDEILRSAVFGGKDVIEMPRYFKPWADGLTELRSHLKPIGKLPYFSPRQRQVLVERLARLGMAPDQAITLLLTGNGRMMAAVLDSTGTRIVAILGSD